MLKGFTNIVQTRLGYYVYVLIDPRNEQVFYIGKGDKDRIFQHEKALIEDKETDKQQRIREIIESGASVKKVIILHGLTEQEAFSAESALINLCQYTQMDGLTNIVAGHHADNVVRGAHTVEYLQQKYGCEKLSEKDIIHNLMTVKLNVFYQYGMTDEEVMNIARGHWKVKKSNAEKADYLAAVYHGQIVGLYEIDKWYPSDKETEFYPNKSKENLALKDRWYCTCKPVPEYSVVYQKYMNKDIYDIKKNSVNPVGYIWGRKRTVNFLKEKYYDGFCNGFPNHAIFDYEFGEDLRRLGFQMDSFERYLSLGKPKDALYCHDYEQIENAMEDIDYKTAGTLLFSKWRYLTHWTQYTCDEKERTFFKAVLERMFELT